MVRVVKSIGLVTLAVIAALFVALLFFADPSPKETIYSRSMIASLAAALSSLALGYGLSKWWLGFIPVLFPLIGLVAVLFSVDSVRYGELAALVLPVAVSFTAAWLGERLSQRARRKSGRNPK